jgi:hypothetical protein
MSRVSPILVRWNAEEKCLDAKVIEQEGSDWEPLMCGDSLSRKLHCWFALDDSMVIKVTPLRNPAGWWEELLERYEGEA